MKLQFCDCRGGCRPSPKNLKYKIWGARGLDLEPSPAYGRLGLSILPTGLLIRKQKYLDHLILVNLKIIFFLILTFFLTFIYKVPQN
jgi:hypothetical protein